MASSMSAIMQGRTAKAVAARRPIAICKASNGAGPQRELRPSSEDDTKYMTTNAGAPIFDNLNSLTVGERGPMLMDDYHHFEKIGNFDRERIPERVVHARGAAAKGYFEVTHDISDLTCAALFSEVGKKTDIIARFSLVVHPSGSPEHLRDVRGFSVKFYTEQGNWDIVGNNFPVFFIRDGMSFPDLIHAFKPNPKTNYQEDWRILDFLSHHPEAVHMVTFLLDDDGIPQNYRHMPGFGVHTFKLISKDDKATYVKFHWICSQGVKNFIKDEDAWAVGGPDHQHATRDLYMAIDRGDYPEWELKIQTMDISTENDYDFDPLDCTKVWPEDQFPLQPVGKMVLNQNVDNFFAENEMLAFAPAQIVPGIAFSNDKMLQSRLFSYADAQRYRLGSNYLQIPVNAPKCPFHNNHYDGEMNPIKRTEEVNYWPSKFDDRMQQTAEKYPYGAFHIEGEGVKQHISKQNNFGQAAARYHSFDKERQQRFAGRVAKQLTDPRVTPELRKGHIETWANVDEELSKNIAKLCDEKLAAAV